MLTDDRHDSLQSQCHAAEVGAARVRLGQVLRAHTSLLLQNGTSADICEELRGVHQILRKDLSLLALLV